MKRLLILLLVLSAYRCHAAVESDLRAGIDPTGYSTITAANLLQLVSNGTIGQTNKGAIIRGPNTPDTVNNPRYTNFIWLDTSLGLPGILKQWAGSSWVTANIGIQGVASTNIANGAVGQPQLATNAVATVNIQNNAVDATKIGAGQVLNTHLGAGVVSNYNIADITIQGTKLAYNTIGGTNIIDASVNGTKLVNQSVTGTQLANGSVGNLTLTTNAVSTTNIFPGAIDNSVLATNAVRTNNFSVNGASAGQLLGVNQAGSALTWINPPFVRSTNINIGIAAANKGFTNAHGLGGVPFLTRLVITNSTPEHGYAVGDEVEAPIVSQSGSQMLSVVANSVNIEVHMVLAGWNIVKKSDNTEVTFTPANWGLKCYVYK